VERRARVDPREDASGDLARLQREAAVEAAQVQRLERADGRVDAELRGGGLGVEPRDGVLARGARDEHERRQRDHGGARVLLLGLAHPHEAAGVEGGGGEEEEEHRAERKGPHVCCCPLSRHAI
jgi:hypothetical protein